MCSSRLGGALAGPCVSTAGACCFARLSPGTMAWVACAVFRLPGLVPGVEGTPTSDRGVDPGTSRAA